MAAEPFHELFKRLIKGRDAAAIAHATGLTFDQIRNLSSGRSKVLDIRCGLRLATYLGISPWAVAGIPEPVATETTPRVVSPDVETELRSELSHLNDQLLKAQAANESTLEQVKRLTARLDARDRQEMPPPGRRRKDVG